MQVLVVDDNIIDRRFTKYIIQNHLNICADTAKDGLDALNKIKRNTYDLVITDIVMPNIEGIELINNIQSISPSTKIIAMSGNNPYYLYIVKKLGIQSVFTKPLDCDLFISTIRDLKLVSTQKSIRKKSQKVS